MNLIHHPSLCVLHLLISFSAATVPSLFSLSPSFALLFTHFFPQRHGQMDSLGDSDSVSMFRAVAVDRAERLVNGHRETPPSASVVSLGGGGDRHQRDRVRYPWAWWFRQRHWGDDGLVITVTTGAAKGRGRKMGILVRLLAVKWSI